MVYGWHLLGIIKQNSEIIKVILMQKHLGIVQKQTVNKRKQNPAQDYYCNYCSSNVLKGSARKSCGLGNIILNDKVKKTRLLRLHMEPNEKTSWMTPLTEVMMVRRKINEVWGADHYIFNCGEGGCLCYVINRCLYKN